MPTPRLPGEGKAVVGISWRCWGWVPVGDLWCFAITGPFTTHRAGLGRLLVMLVVASLDVQQEGSNWEPGAFILESPSSGSAHQKV